MTANLNLTTMSTAGILLPIASASSSGNLEDGPGHYQHRNRTPSLPFSQSQVSPHPPSQARSQSQQSQSQPVSEAPSRSNGNLFLPQDMAQRILGTTSTISATNSPTVTTGGGSENANSRLGGSRPESGDSGVEIQHDPSQSQGPGRQQKMSRREALAQILEYHQGLARSLGRKNGTDGDEDECRGRDGDGDGEERGKRQRRDGDEELDRHAVEETYTNTQQRQTHSQLPGSSSSSVSAGASTSTSSSVPWSSSTITNNNSSHSHNAHSFVPFGEDVGDPSSPSSSSLMNGLQVCTVGHLMPRNKFVNEGNWSLNTNGSSGGASANASQVVENFMYEPTAAASETLGPLGEDDDEEVEIVPPRILTTGPPSTPTTETPRPSLSSLPPPSSSSSSSSSRQNLRVQRTTFVPGSWAVSPRVLLVDDDAVIRKLSSKFLKIFGCTTDVAVDGIGAVTKMNLEKYDLVLMVNLFLHAMPVWS
jgi:hypothetical protein